MKTEEITTQSIEYSRTIVPSSMRSPYWKYFGFPSDNANNILTKQKIICTLCNTAIAYNKNTSNLRTHIIARHCELLHELQQQQQHNGIGSNGGSSSSNTSGSSTLQQSRKRSHTEIVALTLPSDEGSVGTISEDPYTSTGYKRHASIIIEEPDDLVELVEGSSTDAATVVVNNANTLDYGDYTTTLEPTAADEEDDVEVLDQQQQQQKSNEEDVASSSYAFVNDEHIGNNSESNTRELNDFIINMLIKDLLPLSTINGAGFKRLLGQIGTIKGSVVEHKMNSLYNTMLQCITEHLEQFTQTNHYSLSIEKNKNIENLSVICIYVNYYSTEDNELLSILYQSVVSSRTDDDEVIDLDHILKNFNLSNCAAVILNEPNTFAELFFQTSGIPIIPCMECVLRKCLQLFFNLPTVNDEFNKILKVMESEVNSMVTLPEVFLQCPWSKLNLLQFAHENLSFSNYDEVAEILKETRDLIEYISPLKVTLDTIAEEPLTFCSLMRPLVLKLLEEHFATEFLDSDAFIEVNSQVHQELINNILKNKFLNEATFLDARFRRDFLDVNDVKAVKESICIRFKPMLEQAATNSHGNGLPKVKVELDTNHKSTNGNSDSCRRKSSLKSFFKRTTGTSQKTVAATQKLSIEYEFNKYNCEPTLDLEQCPINWWHQNSYNYKQLKQIADYYVNVPCCVNRLFRHGIIERNELQNKRFMLRNQYAQQIWYLHYNEKFYDKIRQT